MSNPRREQHGKMNLRTMANWPELDPPRKKQSSARIRMDQSVSDTTASTFNPAIIASKPQRATATSNSNTVVFCEKVLHGGGAFLSSSPQEHYDILSFDSLDCHHLFRPSFPNIPSTTNADVVLEISHHLYEVEKSSSFWWQSGKR